MYNNDLATIKKHFSSYSFSDSETKTAMKSIYENYNYIADPHGAVGYLGLKNHDLKDAYGVFLETAHPVKFLPTVESTLSLKLDIPTQIQEIMHKEKKAHFINDYEGLKKFLTKSH